MVNEFLDRVNFTIMPSHYGYETIAGRYLPLDGNGVETSCMIMDWAIEGRMKIRYFSDNFETEVHETIFNGSLKAAMVEAQEWLRANHPARKGAVA